jgi:hypothetical protein
VVAGDGGCEAYTVIVWGVLLSLENQNSAEAETVSNVEGNMCGPVMRGTDALPWSKTTSRKDHVGTWEISRSADGHIVPQGPYREGEEP